MPEGMDGAYRASSAVESDAMYQNAKQASAGLACSVRITEVLVTWY